MEGLLAIKDSTSNTEEPVKSEEPMQSPNGSDRSDGAASPPPNCSICLGKLINTSFTDSCLHQFCFNCLLQWSKIKTECPLCKQTFKSIIHSVRSEEDYDQCPVAPELASQIPQSQVMANLVSSSVSFEMDGNWDVGLRRFLYRTTMTGNRRHRVLLNPEQVARREQVPSVVPQVSREERRRRRANPTDYRRMVYRRGIRATSLPDVFGRFRECSAEYYRRQPGELNRLVPWLNRELQVLLNNNAAHVAYVMRVIMDSLTQYDIRSPEFRDLVRPYFGIHTDHFVHELLNYARTSFDIVGYDQYVTYLPNGLSNDYVPRVVSPTSSSSSTTSDDSDVRVLDEAIDLRVNTELPSVGPHTINMPGPSTVGQAFLLEVNVPDVLTISSSSSTSDDECEVIGYVKPRHERTPEIIELISSDSEDGNTALASNENTEPVRSPFFGDTPQPSTSYIKPTSSSSSTSSDTDSDSDYSPRRSRRYQTHSRKLKKSTNSKRRKRSSDAKTRGRRERNLSSSGESDARRRRSRRCSQHGTKKRLSSTSDYSSQEAGKKKSDEKRYRKERYSVRSTLRVRKDLIKREERYTEDDSSTSDSSSETDDSGKIYKLRTQRKSKRKYYTSSSDSGAERNEKITRSKDKARQVLNIATKDSVKKDQKYKENRQSRSRSSSESSYVSQKDKKSSCRQKESQRDPSEYGSQDDSTLMNRNMSRREHKSKIRVLQSSSDSEDVLDHFRSSSQCSNNSVKSYVHRKKSKHKEKYKDKERKRSNSKTFTSSQSNLSMVTSVTSACSKSDIRSASKHSDSKASTDSKEKHKSRKNRKESKHRSQNDSKSKSKKKRRRVLSLSSSNSE